MSSSSSRIARAAILALATSTTTIDAFTIKVTDYECQDRPITADFTQICDQNNTCTFGELAYITGMLNMTSELQDTWNVTASTQIYLDSRLHIATYQTKLATMQPISLCGQYLTDSYGMYSNYDGYGNYAGSSYTTTSSSSSSSVSNYGGRKLYYDYNNQLNNNNNNNNGGDGTDDATYNYGSYSSGSRNECPEAGVYAFQGVPLQLPSVPNKVYDWAATGWTGSATVEMYLDANKYELIGRCQLNLETHMDDSSNSNSTSNGLVDSVIKFLPEGGTTGMIVLGTMAAFTFLGLLGYSMSRPDQDEENAMNFKPMPHVETC